MGAGLPAGFCLEALRLCEASCAHVPLLPASQPLPLVRRKCRLASLLLLLLLLQVIALQCPVPVLFLDPLLDAVGCGYLCIAASCSCGEARSLVQLNVPHVGYGRL